MNCKDIKNCEDYKDYQFSLVKPIIIFRNLGRNNTSFYIMPVYVFCNTGIFLLFQIYIELFYYKHYSNSFNSFCFFRQMIIPQQFKISSLLIPCLTSKHLQLQTTDTLPNDKLCDMLSQNLFHQHDKYPRMFEDSYRKMGKSYSGLAPLFYDFF